MLTPASSTDLQGKKVQQRLDRDDLFKQKKTAKEDEQKLKIEPEKKQEEKPAVVKLPSRREVEPGVFKTVEEAEEALKKFDTSFRQGFFSLHARSLLCSLFL